MQELNKRNMETKKDSIIDQLTQKPWDPSQVKIDNSHEGKTFNLHVGKLGLRYLMIVSTIMFCLFIVTYGDRMVYDDWVKMPEPFLLWINTFVLVISSIIFVRIQIASKKNQFKKENGVTILQIHRWFEIIKTRQEWANSKKIDNKMISELFVLVQTHIMNQNNDS